MQFLMHSFNNYGAALDSQNWKWPQIAWTSPISDRGNQAQADFISAGHAVAQARGELHQDGSSMLSVLATGS